MTDTKPQLRSARWWNDPAAFAQTAGYLERFLNYGLTREELQTGRPIIGIAQTGSDLAPCNRHHLALAQRVKDGVRDAGGVPFEFPVHPIQETGKRPTAALDRNLAYLGLTEILFSYPLDGVVLLGGCDKTTPALLMAAATVDLPAILLSGGPMLDGYYEGKLVGSGHLKWAAAKRYAAGELDQEEYFDLVADSAPSIGHCNTMGTASSMNALAEALGMSLPGSAAIPAPYRQRAQAAYETGKRSVGLVLDDLRPSRIMTREAFENAIICTSAIGGSSNCPPHLNAIAAHMGVPLSNDDWDRHGYAVPLLANLMPAGRYLGEGFYRAGGMEAVIGELLAAGKLHAGALTITGETLGVAYGAARSRDPDIIYTVQEPLQENAGFAVLSGNLFDSALMKTSVISPGFRARYLERPNDPNGMELCAVVFEGPEDYHQRINDPELQIDENCILVIRNCGPVGYPGAPEVVNMIPPDALIAAGIVELPCMGDARQSGTSGSPSILNASPEAAVGGGLALLRTGDRIRIDINRRSVNVLIDEAEIGPAKSRLPARRTG